LTNRYRLARPAKADLDEIWLYVAREASENTADRLINGITSRFVALAQTPMAGRLANSIEPGIRVFPVGNYLIYYRIDRDDWISIVRVIHGMRDQSKAWTESLI
jgi:plasmid stabilization system protein ParE